MDYAKKYYGPGLKRASVEDLARAAGGMEAAKRAANFHTNHRHASSSSYGNALSSFLEPASHFSMNHNNISASSHSNSYNQLSLKSAWRVQNLNYNESYLSLNNDNYFRASSIDDDQPLILQRQNDHKNVNEKLIFDEIEEDLLPDRESILLWCRQHGLGHLETSALDGTGVETAINAVVMLALTSANKYKDGTTLRDKQTSAQINKRYHPKINLQDRYRATNEKNCVCTSGCS